VEYGAEGALPVEALMVCSWLRFAGVLGEFDEIDTNTELHGVFLWRVAIGVDDCPIVRFTKTLRVLLSRNGGSKSAV